MDPAPIEAGSWGSWVVWNMKNHHRGDGLLWFNHEKLWFILWYSKPWFYGMMYCDVLGYNGNIMWDIYIYNLVGGLEHQFYFSIYWDLHHPN